MENFTESSYTGEYYMERVPEMASGFRLNNDMSFNFFFTYGALDRFGNGKWKLNNGHIIFESENWPGHDFEIIESQSNTKDKIIFELKDTNPGLVPYIYISLNDGKPDSWIPFQSDGKIETDFLACSTIAIACEFCPERFTLHKSEAGNNFFRIKPRNWLFEYFFKGFSLQIHEKGLFGKHPLNMQKEFLFIKKL
ncbi:MAG: hypothetical protein U0W24_16335 [Bacteroidales bacterium]